MKKIFFIFAMLLMSVVSVMAEELSETFCDYELTNLAGSYKKAHFTVTAQGYDDCGLYIHNGNKITIRSRNGEKIIKVKCKYICGEGHANRLTPNHGTTSDIKNKYIYYEGIINDVNATSLRISSDVECEELDYDNYFEIFELEVFYEPGDGGSIDEFVLTETFPTSGNSYLGDNIQVDGLSIGNGNAVTISSNNGMEVRILKVELEFNDNFSGTFEDLNDATVEGSEKNWTISNIYVPSLEISSTSAAQIKSIKVHYVKMEEKEPVTIDTTTGQEEYIEGNITVVATSSRDGDGLDIDKDKYTGEDNSVTITSNNGAVISKVELHLESFYPDNVSSVVSTNGHVVKKSGADWIINDINSTSVTTSIDISYTGDDSRYAAQIGSIKVYYKEPVSDIELVAAEFEGAYWTTFYSNACNYQAPEGTEVYKVNLSGSTITMNKIDDGIVTKGEGVVLKSPTSDKITLTKVPNESSDDYYGNSLKGTSATINNPGNAYVLNYKESKGLAFYKLSSNGTIKANRAYLPVPSGSNASAQAFFAFDAATTTGVENINAQDSSEQEEKVYDLQGRRVTKPAKGLYIVNGKKVIMK